MTSVGRAALVVLVALTALLVGYGASRVVFPPDRRGPGPVIDLDNLPPAPAPSTTVEPAGDATVVPPPTLAPTPTAPPPSLPPVTAAPSTPPSPDDDDDADDDDDDDG